MKLKNSHQLPVKPNKMPFHFLTKKRRQNNILNVKSKGENTRIISIQDFSFTIERFVSPTIFHKSRTQNHHHQITSSV